MNSLDYISEEKENVFTKDSFNASNTKLKRPSNRVSLSNYSSASSKKPLSNVSVQRMLSPTNINSSLKLSSSSKSPTFSFKSSIQIPEPATIEELED